MALRYAFNRTVRTPVARRCASAASIISFPTPFPRSSGATITAPRNARPSYVVVVNTPTTRPSRSSTKQPSGESASSRRKSSRVYPHASRSVRAIAASMSRSSSLRIRVPSTTSPVARALPARHIRGIRMSRSACPCGDACTCRGRTRRPPGHTTCRSPCTDVAAAIALEALLHSPKRVLLPFDRADLIERRALVVGQVRSPPKCAGIRFWEVHVQDIAAVDLPPDRDAVHRDRDFLSLVRAFEGFLPAPDRLDAPESPTIRPHDGFPRTDSAGQHTDAKDRRLRGSEHMFAEEEELRRIRDFLATRLGQLPLPLVPPRLIVFDEAVDHIVLEQLQVRMFSEGGLCIRENFQVEREDRAVQRILRRRGIRDVPSRDRSEPGELDRDRSLLALVRESLEGTDRVRFRERPLIDDRVERDPEALLFLHLEDRADRRPFRGRELFLEEPLGEADEGEQQVRDALAELRTDRDHG